MVSIDDLISKERGYEIQGRIKHPYSTFQKYYDLTICTWAKIDTAIVFGFAKYLGNSTEAITKSNYYNSEREHALDFYSVGIEGKLNNYHNQLFDLEHTIDRNGKLNSREIKQLFRVAGKLLKYLDHKKYAYRFQARAHYLYKAFEHIYDKTRRTVPKNLKKKYDRLNAPRKVKRHRAI